MRRFPNTNEYEASIRLARRYRAARERDDRLVGRSVCEHGNPLDRCGYTSCIERRAEILRRANEEGRR